MGKQSPIIVVIQNAESPFGGDDVDLVFGNLLNGANADGVDSCYIWRTRESFDSEAGKTLKKAWNVPDNYIGIGNVIPGYGKPEGKKEAAPRKEDHLRRA